MKPASLFAVVLLLSGGRCLAAGPTPVSSPTPPSPPSMLGAARTAGEAGPVHDRIVREGIAIDVSIAPLDPSRKVLKEGDEAVFRFHITDTATSTPLSGLAPAAWLNLVAPQVEDAAGCQGKVKEILSGSALAKPEIDLNSYQVLALNEDSTITVVDPLFGFGSTKLLAMLFLDSPGEDWVLSADGKRLFVSLPATNHQARGRHVGLEGDGESGTPAPAAPGRLPAGPGHLWVTWRGPGKPASPRSTSPGSKRVAAQSPPAAAGTRSPSADDSRFVFVTNQADGTVSVIDAAASPRSATCAPGRSRSRSRCRAWRRPTCPTGRRRLVAVGRREAGAAARASRPSPASGRSASRPAAGSASWSIRGRDRVHILDAARNRIVQTGQVRGGPDQVTFSEHLAYVRHRGSETVLMIPLEEVGEEGNGRCRWSTSPAASTRSGRAAPEPGRLHRAGPGRRRRSRGEPGGQGDLLLQGRDGGADGELPELQPRAPRRAGGGPQPRSGRRAATRP